MTIQITIDAPDAASALLELRTFLNSGTDIREIHSRALAEVGAPIAAAFVDRRIVEEFQNATTAAPETKKRGRPKKSETPAGGPKPADQAQVSDNSASAPAASTPTAEDATEVAQEPTSPPTEAPAPLSLEQFKAALNELAIGNGGKNLVLVTKALNEYGYGRVKDAKPEHFALIVEKAKELVAA